MGGWGSGRRGGKPVVEEAFEFSLPPLVRRFGAGQLCGNGCVLFWTPMGSGTPIATMHVELVRDGGWTGAHARICYADPSLRSFDGEQRIGLVTTPQPFGGVRWWFICPRTRARVSKLYLTLADPTFASRRAHGMAYRSQRQDRYKRACLRAAMLRAEIDASVCVGRDGQVRRMSFATLLLKRRRLVEAQAIVDERVAVVLARMTRCLRTSKYGRAMPIEVPHQRTY